MTTYGAQSTFPSVPTVGRYVFWERAVASLPPPLAEALRAGGLDDPGTLVEYRRSWVVHRVSHLVEASLWHLRVALLAERALLHTGTEFLFLLSNGLACLWAATREPVMLSQRAATLRPTTLPWCTSRATPKPTLPCLSIWAASQKPTRLPLSRRAATQEPTMLPLVMVLSLLLVLPLPVLPIGIVGLASQTAKSYPLSIDCPGPAVSRDENQEPPDGFPSTAEDLDGLQSTVEMKGCEHFEGRILESPDCKSTAYTHISRVAEKSEEVRQSDFGVQNLPASVSSSELSPHQMGGSLAGTVRFSGMLQSEMDLAHPDGFSRLKAEV